MAPPSPGRTKTTTDHTEILNFAGTVDETKFVSLFIRQDNTPEREETFTVALSNLDGTQAEVDISAIATVTIQSNQGGIVGFAEDTVIADQVYVVNTVISPVILPEPIAADFCRHSGILPDAAPGRADLSRGSAHIERYAGRAHDHARPPDLHRQELRHRPRRQPVFTRPARSRAPRRA